MAEAVDVIPPVDEKVDVTKKADPPEKTSQDLINGVAENIRELANKDHSTALEVVKSLAQQAGLLDETVVKVKTKTEPASSDPFQALTETLKEDYPELADKMVSGFRDIMKAQTAVLEERLNSAEKERVDKEVDDLFNLPEIKEKQTEILALMDTVAPKAGVSIKKYVTTLAKLVQSSGTPGDADPMARIRQNLTERMLPSGVVDETVVKKGPARPTLKESIEAAFNNVRFE